MKLWGDSLPRSIGDNMFLTLNDIRKNNPCENGINTLEQSLLASNIDEFGLDYILDSNGLNDAIWSVRCLHRDDQHKFKHFAVDIVRLFRADMTIKQSNALEYADAFIDGTILYNEIYDCRADILRDCNNPTVPFDDNSKLNVIIFNLLNRLYENDDICYLINNTRGNVLRYSTYAGPNIAKLFRKYANMN